jgi:hypothetical protein
LGKLIKYYANWCKLTPSVKLMVLRAAFILIWIKAGLLLLRFSHFKSLFRWLTTTKKPTHITETCIIEVRDSVTLAAKVLPISLLCLPQALAAKYMLRGVADITLAIGVDINPKEGFQAHAWVEHENKIIIGDWSDSISYKRLWIWE